LSQAKNVILHRRAAMALDAFSSQDKAKIVNALRLLQDNGKGEILQSKTAKLSTSEPMYVMRAGPAIRLIYRTTPGGIEVLDVAQKATLRTFINENVATAVTDKPAPATSATRSNKAKTATANTKKTAARTYSKKLRKTPR
jgi:mRNA-degrading endonuclease RelE of RelBE toxin-antitoxin system